MSVKKCWKHVKFDGYKIIFNKKTGTFTAYQNDEYIFVTPKKTGFLMGHFLSLKECIEKITCTQIN